MDKLKTKIQNADWWEIIYIIIFGLIMFYEFYHTTLLGEVLPVPPKSGIVLMGLIAIYTIAKLLLYKSYTTKEKIFSAIIILAFLIPSILTEYRFLFWIGFLIVGAKNVSFNKILKVYLIIAVTLMVVAFSASQYGIIKDVQFIAVRGEENFIRHAYGICYPTDFAAHLFYITLAVAVLYRDKLKTIGVIWMSLLVAVCCYMTANALTSVLCLALFSVLCIFEKLFRKYMPYFEKVMRWTPVACASVFLWLVYIYDEQVEWLARINRFLTNRLIYGKLAIWTYDVKLFGQDVYEHGFGHAVDETKEYFFLDDSYLRVLLEYGLIVFIIVLLILLLISKKAANMKKNIMVVALVVISIHSVMEHHLINIAYNPMIFALFATLDNNMLMDRRDL